MEMNASSSIPCNLEVLAIATFDNEHGHLDHVSSYHFHVIQVYLSSTRI